jgi:ubiquinone biosynthesis protein COQ9
VYLLAVEHLIELHQLTSPETAAGFLDGLLQLNSIASGAVSEASLFAGYIGRSWIAIAHSKGILPSVSSSDPVLCLPLTTKQ